MTNVGRVREGSGRRISITVAISVAAHAAVALAVVLSPSPRRAQPALGNVELTLEIHAAIDDVVVPPPPLERPTPEIVRGARTPERTTERTVAREPSTVVGPDSVAFDPAPNEPEATEQSREMERREETDEQRRERLRLLLNPSAVARGGFVMDTTTPALSARHNVTRRSAAELGAELSASLRASAMTKAYGGRPPPQLIARTDGTHTYSGHAFRAVIRADGSVQFNDRPNAQLDGVSLSGTFDVTDAIMQANGADPYAAERAWFMRNTEALRQQLEDTYRAESAVVGLRRLRGRLAHIWQDDSLSAVQKRRAIFDEWAEIDVSGADGGGRAIIEQFVRENLPADGDDAFSSDELRRLNAARAGTARFAPYP